MVQETHRLKTWPEYFNDVLLGVKTFELRKADRSFKVNDILLLQEYDPTEERYTGRQVKKYVSSILIDAEKFGLMDGYCILSLGDSRV